MLETIVDWHSIAGLIFFCLIAILLIEDIIVGLKK